jgi:hypothetical protein
MDVNERISELLKEINHLYTCKFLHELSWDQVRFAKNPVKDKMYLYAIVTIPAVNIKETIPDRSQYYKDRIIKVHIGRLDNVNLDDVNFQNTVVNRIKSFGLNKFEC